MHKIYKLFFSILDKTSLEYYVFAGTSIGYVRNEKNVPWSDDYDVMIFETELAKLNTYTKKELEKYGFILHDATWSKKKAGYQCKYPGSIFGVDIFFSKIYRGKVKNLEGKGLYNRKNVPIEYVIPRKYVTIDNDLRIPMFNEYEKDVQLEYKDVLNNVVIHINHKPQLKFNANYKEIYDCFETAKKTVIDRTKLYFRSHQKLNNVTITNEEFKTPYDFLRYLTDKKVKNLYLFNDKYLIYCEDVKYYLEDINISFYMLSFPCLNSLVYLNSVDNIYISDNTIKEKFKKYELINIDILNFKHINVITFGTFDLFHEGHYNILKRAKNYGDKLIVGVSSDELNKIKGKESINNINKRLEDVKNTCFPDSVFVEESLELKDMYITNYNCNLLIMGDDWKDKFNNCDCACIYLARTPNISTSMIKSQILFSKEN